MEQKMCASGLQGSPNTVSWQGAFIAHRHEYYETLLNMNVYTYLTWCRCILQVTSMISIDYHVESLGK